MIISKKNNTLIIILGALLSIALVFFAGNKNGIGLTFDSENYIYAGENLYHHGYLMRPGNLQYVEWAPGYPALIAFLRFFGKDIQQSIFIFHCILIGCSVYFVGKISYPHFNNFYLFTLFFLTIVFSTPLVLDFHFVWSEGVFIFLSVILFYFLLKYLENKKNKNFLYLILFSALISADRQAAIFFIPGVAICLLVLSGKINGRVICNLILFYFLASLPALLWVIRNKFVSGEVMPNYEISSQTSFYNHFLWHHDILTSWFVPDEIPVYLRMICFYLIALLSIFFYFKKIKNELLSKKIFISGFIIFTSYYLLTFLFCSRVGHPFFDEERILSIVYIFGMLSVFLFLDSIFLIIPFKKQQLILITLALWMSYPIVRTIYNVNFWHNIVKQQAR